MARSVGRVCKRAANDGMVLALLLLVVNWLYIPGSVLTGKAALFGYDFIILHARRLAYARAALGSTSHLPGWYTRELLGSPFVANIQNFPWIPSRFVLLCVDPDVAYALGVALSATLAALFTYLFGRRIGLSRIGAAVAAWTFSCAGFFSCRVIIGVLTQLEAYPALPFLLWLADRALDSDRTSLQRRDLFFIAVGSACVAAAGHPQIPVYALTITLLYIICRRPDTVGLRLWLAMGLGVGLTLAAWWPMLLLILRSTRVLPLAASVGDVVMSYHRLLGLIAPGIDGWPAGVRADGHQFIGHPALFWDTFGYVGILPLASLMAVGIYFLVRRRSPGPTWRFFIIVGLFAILCALPLFEPLRRFIPATIFRSPARTLYIYTFSVSILFGRVISGIIRRTVLWQSKFVMVAVVVSLLFHFWDLGHTARLFVVPTRLQAEETPAFEQVLSQEAEGARVAVSVVLTPKLNYEYDSPGGYDSIFLAKPYAAITSLSMLPRDYNEEYIDAGAWSPRSLELTAARFLVTWQSRPDLQLVSSDGGLQMYRVNDSSPRALFVNRQDVIFRPRSVIPEELSDDRILSGRAVLLPEEYKQTLTAVNPRRVLTPQVENDALTYKRPSSDEIVVHSVSWQPGLAYIVEANDIGWTATVDGKAAPILDVNGLGMGICVDAGTHDVHLRYQTPGRNTGVILSFISLFLLGLLIYLPVPKLGRPATLFAAETFQSP